MGSAENVLILINSCEFYYNGISVKSFVNIKCDDASTENKRKTVTSKSVLCEKI